MANTRRKPLGRIAEHRYAKRVRGMSASRRVKTQGTSTAPWKSFFEKGEGSTIQTEIAKTSVQSIVYTYGKKMGKRFKCSYTELEDGEILIKIESVKRR